MRRIGLGISMRQLAFTVCGACLLLFCCSPVEGQKEEEPKAILELGAATSWDLSGGAATFAPNLAAETTPIENWLELEAGGSPFLQRNSTEWDTDLLFKKPWTLSSRAEFMLGIGPEWVHLRQGAITSDSIAGEVAG